MSRLRKDNIRSQTFNNMVCQLDKKKRSITGDFFPELKWMINILQSSEFNHQYHLNGDSFQHHMQGPPSSLPFQPLSLLRKDVKIERHAKRNFLFRIKKATILC